MIIGVPKEIKHHEYRVGLVPSSVHELVQRGHRVMVETNAGLGVNLSDDQYRQSGAEIASSAEAVFASSDLIIKVKEPQPEECRQLRDDQTLFTYLHLAADPEQAALLKQSGCTAIAYETVTERCGRLPLLAPISQVAGRMSIQAGAHCLEKTAAGSGILHGNRSSKNEQFLKHLANDGIFELNRPLLIINQGVACEISPYVHQIFFKYAGSSSSK